MIPARRGAVCLLLALVVTPTYGQVMFNCGASEGYSYYLSGALASPENEGWVEDGIGQGGIQLLRDGTDYDIIYTDALGGRSAKADGGRVIGFEADSGTMVLVVYPNVVETYQFNPTSRKVVWTQNKAHPISRKIAAFVSQCQ
jgi:hypothetical protein